jgi:endonuclease-3
MPRFDAAWVRAHSGMLSARRMSAALAQIARHVGRAPEELAVTKVSRRRDPFHVLVACLISLRTRDEVTDVAAPRLLAVAPTPEALAQTPEARIAQLIYPAGFYRTKARTLRAVAGTLVREHGGQVPPTLEGLLALPGVGRKTANLVLTLGHRKLGICVDTHVHRISNRLGFVRTNAPDETEQVLRARLPRRWWIPINDVLVAFGRTVCAPLSPRCSICPARAICQRVGVGRSR